MKKGFTLVELSIVLVIIGLLIGGILVGQSLIDSAKVNRIVSDLKQYEVAVIQFYSKFKSYPGDAQFFLPPGATNNMLNVGDTNGDGLEDGNSCNGTFSNEETRQVWAHLSQAKMLSKNYLAHSPTNCGGAHNDSYDHGSLAGIVWPYTEFSAFGFTKYPYYAGKSSATTNFNFQFNITPPIRVLAIENKIGDAKTEDSSGTQLGLTNLKVLGNV